jgi:hypothetical protein
MLSLIFYYLILPFVLFWVVLRLIRKYSPDSAPEEIRELCVKDPIEPKYFRAVRLDGRFGHPPVLLAKLGDFEHQEDAVDAAFAAKSQAPERDRFSFLVLNCKGEILQEL